MIRYHCTFKFSGKPVFRSAISKASQTTRKLGLAIAAALTLSAVLTVPGLVQAKGSPDTTGAVSETVRLVNLPKEAQTTERLIRAGGPFPHDKDGVVFGNRERILPKSPRGFYREYTVITPGSRNRGARRIVCGGAVAVNPEACYYSDDHYASFRRIAP
jgi:ribonuclease T1